MPPLHRGAVLTLAGALVTGLLAPAASAGAAVVDAVAPVAVKAPRCDATQKPGSRPAYQGRSASKAYDRIFRPGPRVPHLSAHIPQGLTTWRNWNGRGETLLLLGMYRDGSPAYLVGIDPRTGKHVGTLRTKATHFGALGVVRGWLIAQDNATPSGGPSVRRYKLTKVRTRMLRAARTGTKPFLPPDGKPQRVYGASFMSVHGGSVWIGRHVKSKPDSMYRYTVGASGRLTKAQGPWRVPARTQGLLVTDRNFVFATSAGGKRGKLTVVRRAAPNRPAACLWTPSLPQNMTTVGGRIYAAYESGAAKFARPGTANRITELHTGTMRSLNSVAQ